MARKVHIDGDRFVALWNSDATTDEIGAAFGLSKSWASLEARKRGLQKRAVSGADLPQGAIENAYVNHRMSCEQIRAQLLPVFPTVSATMIRQTLRRRGVAIRAHNACRTPIDEPAAVRMAVRGVPLKRIAKAFGVNWQTVRRVVVRAIGKRPKGRRPRLDVRRLLSLHRHGHSFAAIGRELGCSPAAVCHHVQRAKRKQAQAVSA